MENKINIAELLKYCPQGMELDCTICNNVVTLEGVDTVGSYPIKVVSKSGFHFTLTREGYIYAEEDAKCVIFPKGKTTWQGFQRPFKDGDIVTWEYRGSLVAFIYKERKDVALVKHHFALYTGSLGTVTDGEISLVENEIVFATEEEKQKLFDAIKANGYRWNAETKTLERLPKFKVGDRVKSKTNKYRYTIEDIRKDCYIMHYENDKFDYHVPFCNENEFDLIPNKFDITTLKPFDSRVLVRDDSCYEWEADIFGRYSDGYITLGGGKWKQCIPYEGNEHLFGTTNDCDDFYKIWK